MSVGPEPTVDQPAADAAYTSLGPGCPPVECPGCDGSGDDIRHDHDAPCTLCDGTGELRHDRLLDIAAELARLRCHVATHAERGPS